MPDNGIKFFARGGFKLPDAKEDEINKLAQIGIDQLRREVAFLTIMLRQTSILIIWSALLLLWVKIRSQPQPLEGTAYCG